MSAVTITRILAALENVRAPAMPGEYDLHAMIAEALREDGLEYVHERPLAPRCRIDFLVGDVGIEVKKGRPAPAQLRRQLARYAASEEISALIVVTQRAVSLPAAICGKRIYQVSLNMNWGIALP